MLHTEETVRAGIRVKDGSRVYYLPEGDRLTPSARDWLRSENVRILRPQDAPPKIYTTLFGGTLTGKAGAHDPSLRQCAGPEGSPAHRLPRHDRRAGGGDSALPEHGGTGKAYGACRAHLQEILDFVRSLIRADVLGEPVARGEALRSGRAGAARTQPPSGKILRPAAFHAVVHRRPNPLAAQPGAHARAADGACAATVPFPTATARSRGRT